jgi:uncharacterized protein (DUF697 family)
MAKMTETAIMKVLDFAYDKAVVGVPGFDTAEEMAQNYLSKNESPKKAAKSLVLWQVAKAGGSGFLTGLGGVVTMPIGIPANIASVLYVQVRMIAAIAVMGGYDLRSDQVKTLVYLALIGNSIKDVVKNVAISIGEKSAKAMIKNLSKEAIKKINQRVGYKFLTKFGEKGAVNLVKFLPLVGGIIGGTMDSSGTWIIGKVAIKSFIGE